jgi:RNA polymerase sigma-70 factor (ECF subfamily)
VIRYRARIYTMIHHMTGNEADTWDLSQEVFIKAWRALPGFEERSQFSTWLHRIAHNATCDWLRRKRVRGGHAFAEFNDSTAATPEAGAVTVPHGVQNPDQALENKELGLRIRDALAELSPEHRAVILMKEIDGLSYQEIADAAGCSLGTVMSRLFYARKRLQTLLADLHHAHTSQRQDTP